MRWSWLDRALFLAGIGLLCFLAGAAAIYFNLPPASFLLPAFEGGKAWVENHETAPQGPEDGRIEGALGRQRVSWDHARAYNGYTVVTLRFAHTIFLIDMAGNIVHRWNMPPLKAPPGAHGAIHAAVYIDKAQVFPNGDVLAVFVGEGDTPYGYGLVKMDKDSHVIWSYDAPAHHDFYVDRTNSEIYTLTHRFVNIPPKGLEDLHFPMLVDSLVTLTPDGKEKDKISLLEAFAGTPYELLLYVGSNGENSWDMLHANSVMKLEPGIAARFPLFKAGQDLVSFRNISTIAVIDPSTRKVVWASNGLWKYQHSASFLSNGHILLFDNLGHWVHGQPYARILEIDPNTLGVVWCFKGTKKEPLKSHHWSRVSRLPNGDTLITQSLAGRLLEVAADGSVVWSYKLPSSFGRGNIAAANINDDNLNAQSPQILSATRYAPQDLPFLKK